MYVAIPGICQRGGEELSTRWGQTLRFYLWGGGYKLVLQWAQAYNKFNMRMLQLMA